MNTFNKINKKAEKYKNINFKVKEPVLDIGGDDGAFLLSQNILNATIIGITDKSKIIYEHKSSFNFIEYNLMKGVKLNQKFKTIFLMEVLEHLPNPLYLMGDVYNLLEDDGIVYISIPYTRNSEFGYDNPNRKGLNQHVQRWTLKEIRNELERIGFKVKVLQKRRRFKGIAFWIPHCWLVLECKKRELR